MAASRSRPGAGMAAGADSLRPALSWPPCRRRWGQAAASCKRSSNSMGEPATQAPNGTSKGLRKPCRRQRQRPQSSSRASPPPAADAQGRCRWFQHSASGEPMIFDDIDTLVLCLGHSPVTDLESALRTSGREIHLAGDCQTPRTAEEAVYEGLIAGCAV